MFLRVLCVMIVFGIGISQIAFADSRNTIDETLRSQAHTVRMRALKELSKRYGEAPFHAKESMIDQLIEHLDVTLGAIDEENSELIAHPEYGVFIDGLLSVNGNAYRRNLAKEKSLSVRLLVDLVKEDPDLQEYIFSQIEASIHRHAERFTNSTHMIFVLARVSPNILFSQLDRPERGPVMKSLILRALAFQSRIFENEIIEGYIKLVSLRSALPVRCWDDLYHVALALLRSSSPYLIDQYEVIAAELLGAVSEMVELWKKGQPQLELIHVYEQLARLTGRLRTAARENVDLQTQRDLVISQMARFAEILKQSELPRSFGLLSQFDSEFLSLARARTTEIDRLEDFDAALDTWMTYWPREINHRSVVSVGFHLRLLSGEKLERALKLMTVKLNETQIKAVFTYVKELNADGILDAARRVPQCQAILGGL